MDLDAFFASVEQFDHPGMEGKPVIVGGDPRKTRRGFHCIVRSTRVRRSFRHALFNSSPPVPQRHLDARQFSPLCVEMSQAVMGILLDESSHLMQVSIDEAFLDITPTRTNREHPVSVAQRIQQRVSQLGITCSIGLGESKSVAKIASNQDKPHGLTVVYPGELAAFLAPLAVGEMSGIGPVAQKKLSTYHIRTLGDVASADPTLSRQAFGQKYPDDDRSLPRHRHPCSRRARAGEVRLQRNQLRRKPNRPKGTASPHSHHGT